MRLSFVDKAHSAMFCRRDRHGALVVPFRHLASLAASAVQER